MVGAYASASGIQIPGLWVGMSPLEEGVAIHTRILAWKSQGKTSLRRAFHKIHRGGVAKSDRD